MDKNIKFILEKLPDEIREIYDICLKSGNNLTEIHIRANQNTYVQINGKNKEIAGTFINCEKIKEIFLYICGHTVSAFEDEIKNGYITLDGGIRIGVGGIFFSDENKEYRLNSVSSMNIRIPTNKYFTVPTDVLDFSKGLLIIGKPHSGKTTMLKSICRLMKAQNIAVCDERNELFDLNLNCDFITGMSKGKAILNATRSLNPDIIICDEIGGEEESREILAGVNTGVRFICTAHCAGFDDMSKKANIQILLKNGVFDKIILVEQNNGIFKIEGVKDV